MARWIDGWGEGGLYDIFCTYPWKKKKIEQSCCHNFHNIAQSMSCLCDACVCVLIECKKIEKLFNLVEGKNDKKKRREHLTTISKYVNDVTKNR